MRLVSIMAALMCLQATDPERPALTDFITLLNHFPIISIFKHLLIINTSMLNVVRQSSPQVFISSSVMIRQIHSQMDDVAS